MYFKIPGILHFELLDFWTGRIPFNIFPCNSLCENTDVSVGEWPCALGRGGLRPVLETQAVGATERSVPSTSVLRQGRASSAVPCGRHGPGMNEL